MPAQAPKLIRRLSRIGNSWALTIDRAIVDLLQLTSDVEMELSTDGQSLLCRPLTKQEAKRTRGLIKHVNNVGNSTVLYLDKALLAILRIGPKDDVEMLTDGTSLLLRLARADIKRAEEIADAIDRVSASPVVFSGSGEAFLQSGKKLAPQARI